MVDEHGEPSTMQRLGAKVLEVKDLARDDELTLVSAGVAFYAFLALVPALVAATALYGVFADPDQISRQVHNLAGALPASTRSFLTAQLRATNGAGGVNVSIAAGIGFVLAFWSASAGTAALLRGLAVINDAGSARSYARRRGLALLVTLVVIVVVLVAVWLISVLPPQLNRAAAVPDGVEAVVGVLRWPVLAVFLALAVRGLYHVSSGYQADRFVTAGPIVASLLWLAGSGLFAVYTSNFSSLSRRYGSISSIVVVLLWLYLGALATLIGAEVDAVSVGNRRNADTARLS